MRSQILTLIVMTASLGIAQSDKLKLTFGIVPQQSSATLAKKWVPICQYLSEKTGISISYATAPTIPEFEKRLKEKAYDIAYMNPYHYVVYHESPGYVAIGKAKDKKIKGIIVVAADSPYTSIDQLSGKTLAFPSPAAFAASIIPRQNLKQADVVFKPQYVSSHDSVYLNVSKKIFPAGGGVIRTFNSIDEATKKKLRVLWTSAGYTPHAIAVVPDVKIDLRKKLQEAFAGMGKDPVGEKLLETLKIEGVEHAQDSDWNDVRALNIETRVE